MDRPWITHFAIARAVQCDVINNKSVKNLVPSTTNLFSYCSNLPNTKKPSEEGNEVKLIFDYLHKPYKFMYVSVLIKPCYCCLSLEQVLDWKFAGFVRQAKVQQLSCNRICLESRLWVVNFFFTRLSANTDNF